MIDIADISLAKESVEEADLRQVGAQLHAALSQIGFAYIKNHGIPMAWFESTFQVSMDFFSRATAEVKAELKKGKEFQGYLGGEEIFNQDESGFVAREEFRESFDVTDISAGGIFPDDSCPELRPALTQLAQACWHLIDRLLSCLSLALGRESTFLHNFHQGVLAKGLEGGVANLSTLRTVHYPPVSETQAAKGDVIRCGEHSDFGTLTLLCQDDIGGLEVKNLDGSWIKLKPQTGRGTFQRWSMSKFEFHA